MLSCGVIFGSPAGIGSGGHHGGNLIGNVGHGAGGGISSGIVGGHRGSHENSYDQKPDPFQFEYGVHDDKYHTEFSEHRSGDEAGNIKGEYTVALPDGRIQHVSYIADNYGGTTMEISYKGESRHPDVVQHSDHGHGGVGHI